ncbi:MAG: IclR family transcriptional regulator [Acidobacteriota bacterium]
MSNENSKTPAPQKSRNQSLARGLAILEAISREGSEQGIRELSRKLGLNKSIVHRLVLTLADHGFLEQNPATTKYRIGIRAFEIGQVYVSTDGLQEAALPELRSLAREHHLNAILGVRHADKVVYLLTIPSSAEIVLRSRPGARSPLHSTAVGKALLAGEPDSELEVILGKGPLEKFTSETIVSLSDLRAELEEVRRRGYSINDEEYYPEIFSVGAPVYDQHGEVTAAISGSVPRYQITGDRIPEIVRLVTKGAHSISRRLGAIGDLSNASAQRGKVSIRAKS